MSFKNIGALWSLHDTFTVPEAATLLAGFDPYSVDSSGEYFRDPETNLTDSAGIKDVKTAYSLLVNAIKAEKLHADIHKDVTMWRDVEGFDIEEACKGDCDYLDLPDVSTPSGTMCCRESIDWVKTTIAREHLIAWLASRGHKTGFFFPNDSTDTPGYLDTNHKRFAPKLAAAVKAWEAMEDANLQGDLKPKSAMERWLEVSHSVPRLCGAR